MARPSLDQIFVTKQRPSLDSIFNAQQQSSNPQQMAQQASSMPTGVNVPTIPTQISQYNGLPTQANINAGSTMGTTLQQKAAEANINNQAEANSIPIKQTASLGTKAGEEILSGATSIAKDAELGDLLTSAMRGRNENYALAHRSGLAGGKMDVKLGELLGQNPLKAGLESVYPQDAIKAASDFDAAGNGLLSQGQQLFAGQIGTGSASTRIITTVLHLLGGEFGDRTDSPASLMGRGEGSQRTIYLIQKYGAQYMPKLASMGITPANIDNLPPAAIDAIANKWGGSLKNYKLTDEDRAIIKARTDYINEPLQELLDEKNKNNKSVSYKDVLAGVK